MNTMLSDGDLWLGRVLPLRASICCVTSCVDNSALFSWSGMAVNHIKMAES